METAARISGGILAGGEGRRHGGADKAWLMFNGRPLIAHVLDQLRPQVDEIIVSANRNVDRHLALGLRTVRDIEGAGPLAGVCRMLHVARHPWLLCVPCDAPALSNELAARLFAVAIAQHVDVVVLHDGERAHPTFCLLRTDLAADATRVLASGQSSLLRWQQTQSMAWLRGAAPLNLNTPEELLVAEQVC
ncbi:MAG: molybdenum cofactor guanylyltransferase [Pseudomonadota bacterium]|nr:molybdenum cofactor guanylyltransferase [Pseudomonadota bacterium]